MRRIIGIGGGIGSGKSVVARICRLRGFDVYDCDSRAHSIMDGSKEVSNLISRLCGSDCLLPEGGIDRKKFGPIFFSRADVRKEVNSLVHSLVREDIFRESLEGDGVFFVESAILRSSEISGMAAEIWLVTAPDEVRMARVKARSLLPESEIRKRMDAQRSELSSFDLGVPVSIIVNSGYDSLLLQTIELTNRYLRN